MKVSANKGQNLNLVDGAKADKAGGAKSLKETASNQAAKNPVAPATLGKDAANVDLSDRAQDAKRIKDLAMKAPDVDMEKVARFREMIDSGNYKVDARAVADRMVDAHLEEDRLEAKN